jgi:hypothetical protein
MGGLGGGSEIVQSMRRDIRREESRREARRARSRAKRRALRLQREVDLYGYDEAPQDDRWPFPCALACGTCGQLQWPASAAAGDPLRRDPEVSPTDARPCTACGNRGFVDLASKGMARALVDAEMHDRAIRSAAVRRVVRGVVLGVVSLGAVWWLRDVGLLAVSAFGLGVICLARACASLRAAFGRSAMPRRWSTAHPPRALRPRPRPWLANAVVNGTPMAAPLSGRPCLGYEVAVAWGSGAPRPWALLEQRVSDLEVDGARLSGRAVGLELPRESFEVSASRAPAHVVQYLRARGLELTDDVLAIYESVLEPGASVAVARQGDLFVVGT